MQDRLVFEDGFRLSPRSGHSARDRVVLAAALLTALLSAAVCTVAILTPAPAAAVPLIVAICVGCPVFAAWEAPGALASVRESRTLGTQMTRLRRSLDQLPETEHPLGL